MKDGNITEIQCTYDPLTKSGSGTEESKRKVKELCIGFLQNTL